MGVVGASILIGATIIGCCISNGLDNIAGRIRDLTMEIGKGRESADEGGNIVKEGK
jgi:hypothetical protein